MKVTIRQAIAADLAAMITIKHDAGVAAWSHILPSALVDRLPFPPRWEAAIADPDPRTDVLIVELDGQVVGFAVTRASGDADALPATGELDAFFTAPATWGGGAGRGLLSAATDTLREAGFGDATLWTAALNHRPRRIYESAGWSLDETERHRSFEGVEFAEVRYRIRLREGA